MKTSGCEDPAYWGQLELPFIHPYCRGTIEHWICMCYRGVRKYEDQTNLSRSSDSDMRVVVEFHRQYLINQDSVCIATCAEQIAYNNSVTRKLKNQIELLE